jgi:hypothetical protein
MNFFPVVSAGFFNKQIEKEGIPIREHETRLQQMNSSYETLQKRYLELTESRHVLRETAIFFEEVSYHRLNILQPKV